ncbi:MAG TPA: hypothetical protein VFS44_08295 [Gemmatimonadaceae bacterium]|nr:hypothetical protein [Gemmatimonadaceae bacterium]
MRARYLALALGVLAVGACKDATMPDQNNPSVNDFSTITDRSQVQALATGVIRGDRGQNETEIVFGETIGRDLYRITGSEPRWITELLGEKVQNSDFLGTAMWGAPYSTIRLANIGISGVSSADAGVLSDQEKAATIGFIQTVKGLLYLRIAEVRDTAGAAINVDVDPAAPPVPLSCKGDVLAYVVSLLDSAATNLANGGASFPFQLPSGFAGFDDPASFLKFNRGLAAKANVELAFRNFAADGSVDAGAIAAAQTALNASFMDMSAGADLNAGPMHTYSTNSGDATNGLFDPTIRANPRVRAEADSGDARVARYTADSSTVTVSGVTSDVAFTLYKTPTDPVSILTNKELIALQGEVYFGQNDLPNMITVINFLRTNDGGLTAVAPASLSAALNRLLYEKRYSLLEQSGARWIDARMFGKLNGSEPPVGVGQERDFDPIYSFPIPSDEANARGGHLEKASCSVN